ncbi:btk-binding protein-related [Anaeramoeba flamelloides]|uniref:Btk-binding protein-related n=1 Tax=Anaeramoeba flamelloides TaxID=1746091 RepID=A0AAV7Z663_9EUKA|nr:btk-binding protein-related [Anaeramoeba flamelloides]
MTQTRTQIFYSGEGNNSITHLIKQNENKSPRWTPLSKIKNANKVRKIVSGNRHNCLIWKGINNLEFYDATTRNQKKSFTIENEEIKDIQSGYLTYLILTKSGKVFSLAQDFFNCEVPLSDPESSNYEKIRPVPFFNKKENNRKVETFAMVGWSNYFVCKDGRLGDGTSNQSKNLPVLIFENVTRVFGGVHGYEGKTYGCGRAGSNGFTQDKSTFTEIEELKNKKVVEYFGGKSISLALTNENELFGWGFDSDNHPTDQYGDIMIYKPHLHDLFNDEDSKDFTLLIKNDEDEDEYEEIPVHKIILLTRSGLFREMFENITEESKSVKDYSGKSIESIEILIKYFYTEKIELTADHDPLLIIEELEDSIEYYQLNENSNILIQLN